MPRPRYGMVRTLRRVRVQFHVVLLAGCCAVQSLTRACMSLPAAAAEYVDAGRRPDGGGRYHGPGIPPLVRPCRLAACKLGELVRRRALSSVLPRRHIAGNFTLCRP